MTTPLLAMLLLAQSYYTPEEAQAVFQEANSAYGRGEHEAARQRYERLIEHGRASADVLYNLGTVALAEGNLGEAILALERAKKLGDGDGDIEANLAIARGRQLDQVTGEAAEEPLIARVGGAVPREPVTWIALGAWALGWLCLTWARVRAPGGRKGAWRLLGAVLLVAVSAPAGLLLGAQMYAQRTFSEGVVMVPTLPVRELPASEGRVSFEVHAGLKVRLLQRSGEHVRIRLPNGLEAWAERRAIATL